MHRQIVEANVQLTRRYVSYEPHCSAIWIALTKIAPRVELIKRRDVKRPGIRAGGMIAIPLPNIGSMGGAFGHAQEAQSQRCPSIPVVFRFAALNPSCGADRACMGMLGG